jgi:hypothetical protein
VHEDEVLLPKSICQSSTGFIVRRSPKSAPMGQNGKALVHAVVSARKIETC